MANKKTKKKTKSNELKTEPIKVKEDRASDKEKKEKIVATGKILMDGKKFMPGDTIPFLSEERKIKLKDFIKIEGV